MSSTSTSILPQRVASNHTAPLSLNDLFFFNDTATTEIYTLSLHDALPILPSARTQMTPAVWAMPSIISTPGNTGRSEEHTSELQSLRHLVCRLLLEKKKTRV